METTIHHSKIREIADFDRASNPRPEIPFSFNTNNLHNLTKDVIKNGIKNPVEIYVYENKCILAEGNHRLSIAEKLNITIPYVVRYVKKDGSIKHKFCEHRKNKLHDIPEWVK